MALEDKKNEKLARTD